jgi:hypothetical protein
MQLTDIGALALVELDGAGSTDADDAFADLTFTWTVDTIEVCDDLSATCGTINQAMSYGTHDVTLRVTDPVGQWHEASTTVNLDPAALAVFHIDTANVKWNGQRSVRLTGEIGLPSGVDFSEVSATATAELQLAGVTIAPSATYNFTAQGNQQQRWRYENESGPVTSFEINWDGSRFNYSENNFPIRLKSTMITSSQTVLEVNYQRRDLDGAVVININGQATIDIDEEGFLTSSAPFEVDRPRRSATVTLPFPLQDTSTIEISGGAEATIDVGDYLRGSVGRFILVTEFSSLDHPDGVATLPRTLNLSVTVGSEGYPGSDSLSDVELLINNNRWRYDSDN